NSALYSLKAKGEVIIGIGAATKGNTLLNFCKLDGGTLDYITDASPLKIGKYTPGSHIKIIADQDITQEATYALILPWNIAPMLQKKLAHLGLKFYVPQIEEA
ncbi:MAG: SAM-dependent methyltransferase, partial [Alphaproteobacteria bacterium]|nr:SAM-dependent methyltransferase [Alphaproteobacteria bacterium]